jgi:hypothetical protein
MAFIDDLVTILQTARVGTLGRDIFASSKANIPTGAGPYISITESGGSGPENTHNSTDKPAYVRPNAQILTRATDYVIARNKAQAAYNALYPVRNRFVNNVWYRDLTILQEPFDLGLDDVGRAQVAFNISVTKRPDAASSV